MTMVMMMRQQEQLDWESREVYIDIRQDSLDIQVDILSSRARHFKRIKHLHAGECTTLQAPPKSMT